jgi:hypothetical protein
MGTCKWCQKGGFFRSVNDYGLCAECAPGIFREIQSRAQIIDRSITLVNESESYKTRLLRLKALRENLTALLKYEAQGITTLKTRPSELIDTLGPLKDKVLLEAIEQETEKTEARLSAVPTAKARAAAIDRALLKIADLAQQMDNPAQAHFMQARLRTRAEMERFVDLLDKAHRAEFKGSKKAAASAYRDILYVIERDGAPAGVPPETIEEIRRKVEEQSAPSSDRPNPLTLHAVEPQEKPDHETH